VHPHPAQSPDELTAIQSANLALRFLLELCALLRVGYWGWRADDGQVQRIGLAVGSPLALAIVWGVLVALRPLCRCLAP
jgi:hypothetical protein